MLLDVQHVRILVILITGLLGVSLVHGDASCTQASSSNPTTTGVRTVSVDDATPAITSSLRLCEARTINHITHSLPQFCLTSSWVDSRASSGERLKPDGIDGYGGTMEADSRRTPCTTAVAATATFSESQFSDATVTPFMSFEDWKEMMLRRAGQDPQELRSRKVSHQPHEKQALDAAHHADLGEEEEISLNFENYRGTDDESPPSDQSNEGATKSSNFDETLAYGDAVAHRSKDAGKTCKERFSYASFDAGATVLKAASGAKNARAILVENKDTYMLLECAATTKYVIVELSDDILIDTIVLANFEFFSSMVRHFRVSVSDRYPVKNDKWRNLGIFEARNSRDIQPFLVENPQIWAKYVKIEFLSHYGKEYYCPVSLLRVHGSRMLDSWKESETGRDEDSQLEGLEQPQNATLNQPIFDQTVSAREEEASNATLFSDTTPWIAGANLNAWEATCPANDNFFTQPVMLDRNPKHHPKDAMAQERSGYEDMPEGQVKTSLKHETLIFTDASTPIPVVSGSGSVVSSHANEEKPTASGSFASPGGGSQGAAASSEMLGEQSYNTTTSTTTGRSPTMASAGGKSRSSGSPGSNTYSPAVQEGFFNAITKRLQQVESNLTLSLRYVEEQSRHVQEALMRGEQKQDSKVSAFLDALNRTVFSELRSIRDQYDQIWQSTVLALESQSDRSERDMMALSARLNLLADEVVFQKRMAIVQAVILLSCLFLVIFSRGVPASSLMHLSGQATANGLFDESLNASFYGASAHCQRRDIGDQNISRGSPEMFPGKGTPISHIHCHTGRHTHLSDDPDALSTYRGLSPPLTPGHSHQPQATSFSASCHETPLEAGDDHARRIPNLTHTTSRKPLPSLPEHPASPHEP